MSQSVIKTYASHIKVNLLWANSGMVGEGWTIKPYRIQENKIYFIDSGHGMVSINGKSYHPKAGQMLFIPSGCLQGLSNTHPERYVKWWCHFDAYIGTTPLYEMIDFPLLIDIKETEKTKKLLDQIIYYHHVDEPFAGLKANSLTMELLYMMFSHMSDEDITLRNNDTSSKIESLLAYMEKNIHHKMTNSELAERVGLHPNYLIRLFKQTFGFAPIEYLNRLRIEKAKEMIDMSDEPIKEISAALGFSTQYYFSNVFKKQMGQSPTDYRKGQ